MAGYPVSVESQLRFSQQDVAHHGTVHRLARAFAIIKPCLVRDKELIMPLLILMVCCRALGILSAIT